VLPTGQGARLDLRWSEPYIVNQMMRRRISRFLVFTIFAFWTTAGAHAFSLGLGGTGTLTMSAGQGFGPKLQYGGGLSIDFVFPILAWLRLDASIEGFTVAPSDISGGFLYRGYSGGAVAVMVQAEAKLAASPGLGVFRWGGGLGAAGALPSYWYTTLAFFYPELRAEALLDWEPAALPRFTFGLSIPVRVQLRRDLDYSACAGLGLGVSYRLGGA
jgi:hypothetical protein